MNVNDLGKGLIVGGAVGIALGMLFAPKVGSESRQAIRDAAGKMIDSTKGRYENARKRTQQMGNTEEIDPDSLPEPCNACL
jgi:gas vesicle protein